MIRTFWRFVFGYIVVTVTGDDTERFLNRMAEKGASVWDIERFTTGMLVARMGSRSFKHVRSVARRQGWRITIVDRVGLPFVLARGLKRKTLFVGAALALVGLYAASGYVWFVDVQGAEGDLADEVLYIARKAGLKQNVRKNTLDLKGVTLDLLLNVDALSWATVHVKGTRAIIEVAERTTLDAALTRPGDVVAARDGMIEHMAVSQGYPVADVGQTVRRGDIVISGFIPPDDPRHRQLLREGKAPYVRADGIVSARVWYESRSRVRLVTHQAHATGRKARALDVTIGDKTWRLGRGAADFAEFEESAVSRDFAFGSWRATITYRKYNEQSIRRSVLNEEEAKNQAAYIALADLRSQWPEDVVTVEEPTVDIHVVEGDESPVVEATARVEVVQNIHVYRPHP